MKLKLILTAITLLAATAQALPAKQVTDGDLDLALELYISKHIKEIQKTGAKQIGKQFIQILPSTLRCIGEQSSSGSLIGVCHAAGDLDYPNSGSTFSIVVSDSRPGMGDRAVKLTVILLSSEI